MMMILAPTVMELNLSGGSKTLCFVFKFAPWVALAVQSLQRNQLIVINKPNEVCSNLLAITK